MEPDLSKLFIGGISWETDENRLREYFSAYGEVVEAVIMRDRVTGRARGFGFIIFVDPAVADRVAMVKHMIDGRTVEAKKAVPRDDQHTLNRNNHSIQGSPGPGSTKKIFVGGLASTVTESDFKKYFDQFGTITDVVVMYDHNTQRPRGFGFITYDSEEAVDRVLHNTFHEVNGKMVEVKRAVPKELSPGPSRSPLVGHNYGFSRADNFIKNYSQGYNNLSSVGGFGDRMDGRFNMVASGRLGFSPFGSGYGMGVNLDPGLSSSFGGGSKFSNNLGYGQVFSPYYGGNSNRYNTPIGYGRGSGRCNSILSSSQNVWGDIGLHSGTNVSSPGSYLGSVSGSFGVSGNSGENWGSPPISVQAGRTAFSLASGTVGYGGGENGFGLGEGGFRSNSGTGVSTSSLSASSGGGSYGDLYRGGSVYGDSTWQSASSELEGWGSFGYGLSNAADVKAKGSEGYVGG